MQCQIDYMLVCGSIRHFVTDCKSIPEKPVATHHRLVVFQWTFTEETTCKRKSKEIKLSEETLKTRTLVKYRLHCLDIWIPETPTWEHFSEAVREFRREALAETTSGRKVTKKLGWWKETVEVATKHKRKAFQYRQLLQSIEEQTACKL